jgi:hypothetical protein
MADDKPRRTNEERDKILALGKVTLQRSGAKFERLKKKEWVRQLFNSY